MVLFIDNPGKFGFSTLQSFLPILDLRFLDGLPLHIAGSIEAARAERNNMVDDVAGAAASMVTVCRAGVVPLKFRCGCSAAGDTAGVVAGWVAC